MKCKMRHNNCNDPDTKFKPKDPDVSESALNVLLTADDCCGWDLQDTNSPDDGAYSTDCLNNFQFNEGLVDYNGFLFCPFCGKKIRC